MSAQDAVLAIGLGTSSVRAAWFGLDGQPQGLTAQRHYPLETAADGTATLDPATLVDAFAAVIDEALAARGGAPPLAVATSAFWHSLLGLDAAGVPVTPVLTWADRRAAGVAALHRQRIDAAALHAATGCPAHSSYWTAKLPWMRQSQPQWDDRVTHWVSAIDHVMACIGGTLRTSVSMASGTGLYDLHRMDWSDTALALAGVGRDRLPVPDPGLHAGLRPGYAQRWPALAGVPWLPAVGDGACSNIGVGGIDPRTLVLMVGTSGSMRMVWEGEERTIQDPGLWCYLVDDRRRAGGMALSEGGASAAWARQLLPGWDPDVLEAEVAALAPDAHGLTVLPYVLGARSPDWLDGKSACIAGITASTRPVDIYRAMLESVGLRLALLRQRLELSWPAAARIVVTGGGLSRSAAWRQIIADCMGRPIEVAEADEGSLRGAALLAIERLGAGSLDAFDFPVRETLMPRSAATAAYGQALARQDALDRALGVVPH